MSPLWDEYRDSDFDTDGSFVFHSSTPHLSSSSTGPCCPVDQVVDQVTQAMSNVSWSPAKGAHTFITSLTSTRGHARCHTMDSHCLMGCITCGTNYTVTMEAISHSGRRSNCSYEGFSSSEWLGFLPMKRKYFATVVYLRESTDMTLLL